MQVRLSTIVARFTAWAEKCRSPITVNVYRHYFRKFLDDVGDMAAAKLTPAKLTAWASTWHASQAIVRLYRWAVDDAKLLKANPLLRVMHPPKGERKRIVKPDEQTLILRASAADFRRLLIGYRETMGRPGELRAATWADLHPQTTRAELRKALRAGQALIVLDDYKNRKRRRSPNEPRVILLSPRVGRMICRLMKSFQRSDERIFLTARRRAWTPNAVRCRMRRLRSLLKLHRDRRGENIVPYSFRHTGATKCTAAGIRDRVLADLLGHIETSTTMRYQHLEVEHLRSAIGKVWAARGRPR